MQREDKAIRAEPFLPPLGYRRRESFGLFTRGIFSSVGVASVRKWKGTEGALRKSPVIWTLGIAH